MTDVMRLLVYSTLAEVVDVAPRKPEFLHPMLDSCCQLFNHILVFVVLHYGFAKCEVRASAEVLKCRRPLVRIVVLEVLDNLEVSVHRHVLLKVALVPAEALRAQHVLRNAVNHQR